MKSRRDASERAPLTVSAGPTISRNREATPPQSALVPRKATTHPGQGVFKSDRSLILS